MLYSTTIINRASGKREKSHVSQSFRFRIQLDFRWHVFQQRIARHAGFVAEFVQRDFRAIWEQHVAAHDVLQAPRKTPFAPLGDGR